MTLNRREALVLATGLAACSGIASRAGACGPTTHVFISRKRDRERMSAKFDNLRSQWNAGRMEDFFTDHCAKGVGVNFTVDGRGGRWSKPADIRLLHDKFPKITADFSSFMFDPYQPIAYSMAVFEAATVPPPKLQDDAFVPCGGQIGGAPVFAVSMRFAVDWGYRKSSLVEGRHIVQELTFRKNTELARGFTDRLPR